jgi:hypothetical protein
MPGLTPEAIFYFFLVLLGSVFVLHLYKKLVS